MNELSGDSLLTKLAFIYVQHTFENVKFCLVLNIGVEDLYIQMHMCVNATLIYRTRKDKACTKTCTRRFHAASFSCAYYKVDLSGDRSRTSSEQSIKHFIDQLNEGGKKKKQEQQEANLLLICCRRPSLQRSSLEHHTTTMQMELVRYSLAARESRIPLPLLILALGQIDGSEELKRRGSYHQWYRTVDSYTWRNEPDAKFNETLQKWKRSWQSISHSIFLIYIGQRFC